MHLTVLGVTGPGFLNQVPRLGASGFLLSRGKTLAPPESRNTGREPAQFGRGLGDMIEYL